MFVKIRMNTPITMLPITARGIKPAASTMPAAIAQKRKAISRGSLIAVLNRTIESAPTIPRERTTLEVTARIRTVVIIVSATRVTPKEEEIITPLKLFLYTKKIKSPIQNERISAMVISRILTLVTFSKKLDLKISLKFIINFPF